MSGLRLRTAYRALKSYLRFKLGKPRLGYVVYCCTARCNLRCVFCGWWRRRMRELETEDALKAIRRLADFGVVAIDFSGGEPTLRKDLEVLAGEARDHGVYTILSTNGTLITEDRAIRLSRVFDLVNVSLDGFEPTHDSTRGVPGTYRRVMRALNALKEAGVKTGIDLTIYSSNIDEVVPLFKSLIGLVDFVSFQPVMPYPAPKGLKPSLEKVSRLVEELLELKRENPAYVAPTEYYIRTVESYFRGEMAKICDAGVLYAMVDPDGTLLACNAVRDSVMGNIVETSLEEIWASEARVKAIKALDKCRGCLSQCTTLISMSYRSLSSDLVKGVLKYV